MAAVNHWGGGGGVRSLLSKRMPKCRHCCSGTDLVKFGSDPNLPLHLRQLGDHLEHGWWVGVRMTWWLGRGKGKKG